MDAAPAITLKGLTKRYPGSKVYALHEVSLGVAKGEVYGFLGSNGAGKSTTIRLLLNFLQPTRGSITILGLDGVQDSTEIKKHIGYLAGDVALYNSVPASRLFDYLGALQGGYDKDYLKKLITRFEADIHKPIGQLSKGNRQKIGLIQALMHQPGVLILDEPTSGLDPVMQERFYDTIAEAKKDGAAVFLSSHSLEEVQRMCDRVGIIRRGELVREGKIDDFGSQIPDFVVTFTASVPKELAQAKTLETLDVKGKSAIIRPTKDIASALATLSKYHITNLQTRNSELEEEFMSYYQEDKTQ